MKLNIGIYANVDGPTDELTDGRKTRSLDRAMLKVGATKKKKLQLSFSFKLIHHYSGGRFQNMGNIYNNEQK